MHGAQQIDELIIAAELRRMGQDAREYRRARERGEFVRPHRGVYVGSGIWAAWKPWQRYEQQVLGAARASRNELIVSHASAAALWGAPLLHIPALVHVLSANKFGTRVEGGFHRHATAHADYASEERLGVRATSLARCMAEIAASMPFKEAVVPLDWALAKSTKRCPKPVTTKADILEVADRLGIVRGRRRLERVLAFADGRSESPGESLSRATLFELGFPHPELQVDFVDADGFIGRVDFWWPECNLIGEFDGVAKYVRDELKGGKTVADVVIEEKNREN